jgi:hypothetical protein
LSAFLKPVVLYHNFTPTALFYRAVFDLYNRRDSTSTFITLSDELGRRDQLDAVGGWPTSRRC